MDRRWSVATWHTSRYLVTSQAEEPSNSLTRETGSVLRSRANSAGGSSPDARRKGKLGVSTVPMVALGGDVLKAVVVVMMASLEGPRRRTGRKVVGRQQVRRSVVLIWGFNQCQGPRVVYVSDLAGLWSCRQVWSISVTGMMVT